jgi:hypothetical protein
MEEIVQQVAQRTGISEDMARKAVDVVMDELQKRLPAPLASRLKEYASGKGTEGPDLSDAAKMAGGMFGK